MALKPVGRSRPVPAATQAVVSDVQKKWGDESPLLAEAVDLLATVAGRKTRRADDPLKNQTGKSPTAGDRNWRMKDNATSAPLDSKGQMPKTRSTQNSTGSPQLTSLRSNARQIATMAGSTSKQAQVAAVACELASQNIKSGSTNARQLSLSLNEVSRKLSQLPALATQSLDRVANAGASVDEMSAACHQQERIVKGIASIAKQLKTLSFSTTMESSRPGAGGSSFAIIAGELQKLSRRLTRTGKLVRRQLSQMNESACSASQAMEDASDSLRSFNDCAMEAQRMLAEKRSTAESVARDVSDAVNALEEATTASTKLSQSMTKCTSGIQQLQSLAEKLS